MGTPLDRIEIAPVFHTALRKAVDSTASSVTWNLIYLLPDAVKASFYDHLCNSLDRETFDAAKLRAAARSWRDNIAVDLQRAHNHEVQCLSAAIDMHDHDDWTGIAHFIRECGLAPKAPYQQDDRSHWIDGGGFKVEVVFKDSDGVEFGDASISLKSINGEPLTDWRGSSPDGSNLRAQGVAGIVELIEKARQDARTVRLKRLEDKARPEIAEQMKGFDLVASFDASKPTDARLLELAGSMPELLLRWPSRHDGIDQVVYVYCTLDAEAKYGRRFWSCSVHPSEPKRDRQVKSTIQRWIDGDTGKPDVKITLGTDDDLISGRLTAVPVADELRVYVSLVKIGGEVPDLLTEGTALVPMLGMRSLFAKEELPNL